MQLSGFYAKPAKSLPPGRKKPLTIWYRHEKDSCRQVLKKGMSLVGYTLRLTFLRCPPHPPIRDDEPNCDTKQILQFHVLEGFSKCCGCKHKDEVSRYAA